MTSRIPNMPSPFTGVSSNNKVHPNPRTVRASDFTWFNTCGANIIKTDYNTCSGSIKTHMFPWGILPQAKNTPFNLTGGKPGQCDLFKRFDLYGVSDKCDKQLNRCKKTYLKDEGCSLFSGSYINPN